MPTFTASIVAPSLTPFAALGDRPTATQIDQIVEHYHHILEEYELADERYEDCKNSVIALVQRFGTVPVGAEKSLRLEGRVNILTVTVGSTTNLNEPAVADLKSAMVANKKLPLFENMFIERSRFSHRKNASSHLRTAKISKRLGTLFTELYVRCFAVKVKEPSLRIDRIDAEKRKSTRKGGR